MSDPSDPRFRGSDLGDLQIGGSNFGDLQIGGSDFGDLQIGGSDLSDPRTGGSDLSDPHFSIFSAAVLDFGLQTLYSFGGFFSTSSLCNLLTSCARIRACASSTRRFLIRSSRVERVLLTYTHSFVGDLEERAFVRCWDAWRCLIFRSAS